LRELRFAFISDGEVFHYLSLQDDPAFEGVIAGLRSGPILVELPEGADFLPPGTKYENGEFILPEAKMPEPDYEVED
jgi:hypothetical protein